MNVGLIGNGYWGSIVESKLKNLCNLKFVANSKINYKKQLKNVEWVFICTPTNTHYKIAKTCLQHNKHIFCEKPFTGNYENALELITLAQNKHLNLFVDNIFLYRTETQKLTNNFKNISFIWNKNEKVNQNICDSLLYHDIYLLLSITKIKNWNILNKKITTNTLELNLSNKDKKANFYYDRSLSYKEKFIKIDEMKIDYSIPKNDPLFEIIEKLKNNSIDYLKNQNITLKTLQLLTKIKQYE